MEKTWILEAKQQLQGRSVDPAMPLPQKHRITAEELADKLVKYREFISILQFFVDKFLTSVPGSPFLIGISDDQGNILAFQGDPSILDAVNELGIVEGVSMIDENEINSVMMCLRYGRPFELIGEDHYYHMLSRLACCTVPFYWEDGRRVAGTISFMTDIGFAHPHLIALLSTIADSAQRELLLRRQNLQLQILNHVLLETNYYGVIVTDETGSIIEINDTCLAILQADSWDKASYVDSSVYELETVGAYFERVLVKDEACIGVEICIRKHDQPRYYILDVVPIRGFDQVINRAVASLRDITEIKSTEAMLRNTEKLIFAGQLAVSIAHEVRNPLTTVKGMMQLSGKQIRPDYYSTMMSELDRMNLIVSEFMILGKPQSVVFKEEQCLAILQEVLHVFDFQATMNGIIINSNFQESLVIRCDRNQIKQMFLNILKNAMEAMPFGGTIEIDADTAPGPFQRIRISDNGEGMTDKVLRQIGEPFHTTKPDGNGLGMMIVRKIIASHKGRMSIESKVDEGTTVEICLPGL
ncbi:ATP-binding protein [Paenibacillus solisilvae]|uniref:histidine kinase n=1 Tax=Paenibacillus solisilvae TaxID=2486751 RepID=A0ABW0W9S6_9BACL